MQCLSTHMSEWVEGMRRGTTEFSPNANKFTSLLVYIGTKQTKPNNNKIPAQTQAQTQTKTNAK